MDHLPQDLIDLAKACKLAHCHIATMHRWLKDKRLAAWKRCGRLFVSEAAVKALFEPADAPNPIHEMIAADKAKRKQAKRSAAIVARALEIAGGPTAPAASQRMPTPQHATGAADGRS